MMDYLLDLWIIVSVAQLISQSIGEPEKFIASECYGGVISLSCRVGHKIRVLDDFFGYSDRHVGPDVCGYHPKDCTITNNRYISVIHRFCEGKQSCTNFQVDRRFCGSNQSNYEQVEYACVPDTDVIDVCSSATFIRPSGFIATPNFPHEYPANLDCYCDINTLNNKVQIQLEASHFIVKYDTPCRDWLEIGIGDQKRRVCGAYTSTLVATTFNLTFHSDKQDGHQGFWMYFSVYPPSMTSQLKVSCNLIPRKKTSSLPLPFDRYRKTTVNEHNSPQAVLSTLATTDVTQTPLSTSTTPISTKQKSTTSSTTTSTTTKTTPTTPRPKASIISSVSTVLSPMYRTPVSSKTTRVTQTSFSPKTYTVTITLPTSAEHTDDISVVVPEIKNVSNPVTETSILHLLNHKQQESTTTVDNSTTFTTSGLSGRKDSTRGIPGGSTTVKWDIWLSRMRLAGILREMEKQFKHITTTPSDIYSSNFQTSPTYNASVTLRSTKGIHTTKESEELTDRRTTGIIVICVCTGGIILVVTVLAIILCITKRKRPKKRVDKENRRRLEQRLNSLSFYDSIPIYDQIMSRSARAAAAAAYAQAQNREHHGIYNLSVLHNTPVPLKVPTPKPPPPPPPLPSPDIDMNERQSENGNLTAWRDNANYWPDHVEADCESAIYAEIGKPSTESRTRCNGSSQAQVPSTRNGETSTNFSVHLNPHDKSEDIYTHV